MGLRYEIADMAPGPMREAAIDAYVAQARAGVHLIDDAKRPEEVRARWCRAAGRAADAAPRAAVVRRAGRALAAVEAARAACGARARASPGRDGD